ncbi:MAG: hypothetical protein U1F68_08975 [Gammaproteobacteria bacterium]
MWFTSVMARPSRRSSRPSQIVIIDLQSLCSAEETSKSGRRGKICDKSHNGEIFGRNMETEIEELHPALGRRWWVLRKTVPLLRNDQSSTGADEWHISIGMTASTGFRKTRLDNAQRPRFYEVPFDVSIPCAASGR